MKTIIEFLIPSALAESSANTPPTIMGLLFPVIFILMLYFLRKIVSKNKKVTSLYSSYSQVPFYRKQWFFWLMYFTVSPIAIGLLLFGDIYYQKNGEVYSFGLANRIVAGMILLFILYRIINMLL